jgi:asparagine synthase (glutamine-hydrolysing)
MVANVEFMSGIGGLISLDRAPVSPRELERMAGALRMYGPDRSDVLAVDGAGFVNTLMRMTPEDRFDRQPFRGASGAIITADVRLDDRDDILRRIGIAPVDAMAAPDSQILLAAWEKLGDALWPMLRGAFAVAIWEPRRRRLTLARDHLGMNVVMWHRNARFFAFASMPKGLFALADVPRELNEAKVADFLVLNHADHATTIYRDIFRLPPAHVATIDGADGFALRRYWSAGDVLPVRLPSDEAYAEALREHLDRAVRRQSRSIHPIACTLTGGLDSSSVAALAARALAEKGQRLPAYTHVPRPGFSGPLPSGRYADETPFVEAIRTMSGNIDVTYVRTDHVSDFDGLEKFFLALDGPVRNPVNFAWMMEIPRLARSRGQRVLLGGLLGNFTISWNGRSQSLDHLLHGRVLTAYRQWRMLYRQSLQSRWMVFRQLFVEPLMPDAIARWAYIRRKGGADVWSRHSAISPKFAETMQVNARAQATDHDFLYRGVPGERLRGLSCTDFLGDWRAASKACFGVEERDPTADVDVVSFCLGAPPEQYLIEGIERSLIRRAMWGLLPETVLTHRLSGLQSADWFEKFKRDKDRIAEDLATAEASPFARTALDFERLRKTIKAWPGRCDSLDVIYDYNLALGRAVAMGRFIKWFEGGNRSAVTLEDETATDRVSARLTTK